VPQRLAGRDVDVLPEQQHGGQRGRIGEQAEQ
jgi:hypothetical protein